MDSKSKEPWSGGEPEEDTVARKRSRRVSFAETTAVHVFDRDEDFDTPPDSKLGLSEGSTKPEPGGEGVGFQGEHSDTDDSKVSAREEEDDEEDCEQERFVRDMDLSSPGSALGSATSNDEDNFFGPVSTSFIRSGQFSDAGMSDDNNHDITLDSTAFSLHFHNIAPPVDHSANSGGSLMTPTVDLLPTDSRDFVIPKGFKKQIFRSGLSDGKLSGSAGDSSNMSLIVEDPDRYNYGKISPRLEALLDKVNKCMKPNSPISGSILLTSEHRVDESAALNESRKDETHIDNMDTVGDVADDAHVDSHLSEGCSVGIDTSKIDTGILSPDAKPSRPIDSSTNTKSQATSPRVDDQRRDVPGVTQSTAVSTNATEMLSPPYRKSSKILPLQSGPAHLELFREHESGSKPNSYASPESVPGAPDYVMQTPKNAEGQQQLLESEYVMQTPINAVQPLQSPLEGSVTSLRAKRQQLFLDPALLSQGKLIHTPAREEPPSSLKMELIRHGERISAIKSHISKSKIHKSSIINDSRATLSEKYHLPLKLKGTSDKMNDDPNIRHIGVALISKEDNFINQQARGHEISLELNHAVFQTANNVSVSTRHAKNEVMGEKASIPQAHGSSLSQTAVQLKESSQVLDTFQNAISSPIRIYKDKVSAVQEGNFSPGADQTIGSSSFLTENKLQSPTSLTFPHSNRLRKLCSPEELQGNDILYDSGREVESSMGFNFGSHAKNDEIKKDLLNTKDKLLEGEIASYNKPAFEDAYKQTATVDKPIECLAEETIQTSGSKTDSDNKFEHSVYLSKSVFPKPLHDHDIDYHVLQSVGKSCSVQDDIIGRKRGIDRIFLVDKDHVSDTRRIQKSPKVSAKVDGRNSEISSGAHEECKDAAQGVGGQAPQKHSTDILFKLSEATKLLSLPLINLNSEELDIFEDVLADLQTARKYERLSTSLRNHNFLGDHQQQRVADASSLIDKLVYEKAKLQLKHIKLDQLNKKAQLCESRTQECNKLKSIYSQLCVLGTRPVQTQKSQLHSISISSNSRNQEEYNRVATMKKKLEILDQKVKHMMRSFESSCKIKGHTSCDGIIEVVNNHLETRNRCRIIQQDLQLWKLSEVVNKNDCCDIVLNYCNLLFQRFTVSSSTVSSIVAKNLLSHANIEKNFPNMNSCIAFEFVFNAKGEHKLASSKHIQQETLETSLLLGTLCDVLEELLISQMEVLNLISSTFHLQCSDELGLQLCFLSLKNGRKVTLSLDMTNLNCAVYPSEPSELQFQISEGKTLLPLSFSNEIMGAVQSLQGGRTMITRLCRSISQVIQASTFC